MTQPLSKRLNLNETVNHCDSNYLANPIGVSAQELVLRAREGCGDSFNELARRYFPKLVQLIRARCGPNVMDAEDVAQESLARAYQNLSKFDSRYQFSTWLYTIAIRLAIDHNRSYRRRMQLVEQFAPIQQDRSIGFEPGQSVEQSESVAAIWQVAHNALNPTQYTAMWLRFSEEMSIEEVARVMGKTQVGVRVLLHRSRLIMLKELSKDANAAHNPRTAVES